MDMRVRPTDELNAIVEDALRWTNGNVIKAAEGIVDKVMGRSSLVKILAIHYAHQYKKILDGAGHGARETQSLSAAPSKRGIGDNSTANPAHEPSAAQKNAAAALKLRMAKSVLDTFKVRDGRAIRIVHFRELPALKTENAIEDSVASQLQARYANVDPGAQIGDVVKAKELEAIIAKAKKDVRRAA